ncbi:hypothetical protein ANN_18997 [Periplaneta americana]|uniref:Uncharacterized protein n=1 Tax=Periplaneta americana TaxID=6978 RepID=A0ABQ8SSF5_PERAM|nr:hypothetical protein ANN_18997 [Periplaneta americana]
MQLLYNTLKSSVSDFYIPTIRMERDLNQAHQVDQEKRAIYEPCIPYLSAKYNIPLFNWTLLNAENDRSTSHEVTERYFSVQISQLLDEKLTDRILSPESSL